jgi:hypothetical protein
MPTLPADLQKLLDELNAADASGAGIAAGVTDEQFHWRPFEGRAWSIAQCLDHLAMMNTVYLAAIRSGVDDGRARSLRRQGPARSTFFGRWFVRSMEPPVKTKMKAPRAGRSPRNKPREQILREYHAAHDVARQLIADAADIDLNRTTFRNPFISIVRMRIGTGLAVVTAHDRRHLWQAAQVKLAPGFPYGR